MPDLHWYDHVSIPHFLSGLFQFGRKVHWTAHHGVESQSHISYQVYFNIPITCNTAVPLAVLSQSHISYQVYFNKYCESDASTRSTDRLNPTFPIRSISIQGDLVTRITRDVQSQSHISYQVYFNLGQKLMVKPILPMTSQSHISYQVYFNRSWRAWRLSRRRRSVSIPHFLSGLFQCKKEYGGGWICFASQSHISYQVYFNFKVLVRIVWVKPIYPRPEKLLCANTRKI